MTEREKNQLQLPQELTRRPVNPGAEKWMEETIPVLDHGFVYLVDYMGSDEAIEQAARVSYGRGTRKVSLLRGLIRYLKRKDHSTPFEMVEFKFHAKMPIFVARQWVRHRTANINEYSARYSILDNEFYIPEQNAVASQSSANRQGRGEVFESDQAEKVRQLLIADSLMTHEHYEFLLNDDGSGNPIDKDRPMLARELARIGLTLNFYTQWYWKIDLHNLFRFIKLRADKHAQEEIRAYAEAIGKIIQDSVPIAWEAFVDYQLESISFSRQEKMIIAALLMAREKEIAKEEILQLADEVRLDNKRERAELLEKFESMGILKTQSQ